MTTIEVVICTHNRVRLLENAIRSLNMATRPDHCSVKLRIVANRCTDGTAEFLSEYETRCEAMGWLPISWEEEPVLGKSRALNRVLSNIESDVIAFVDDDHRVDQNYLNGICEAVHAYPEASLFCGRILPDWTGTEPAWVHEKGPFRIYPLPIPRFDLGNLPQALTREIAVPGGGNLVIRTKIARQVGEFLVDLGPVGHSLSGGEDLQWVLRALRRGAKLQYVPDVVQYHYVDSNRLTLWYLMRKAYLRSAANIEFARDETADARFPKYLLRKLAQHVFFGMLAIKHGPRRFHLVRAAACIGEISGFRRQRKNGAQNITKKSGVRYVRSKPAQVTAAEQLFQADGRPVKHENRDNR